MLETGLTAALAALAGPIGFALGVGLAILTARDPTPTEQRNALPDSSVRDHRRFLR